MAQFSEAKVGDKVWDLQYGWGKIEHTNLTDDVCPLWVQFSDGLNEGYDYDGKKEEDDLNPTLFWSEVVIDPPERPKEECEACGLIYELGLLPSATTDLLKHRINYFLLSQHHSPTCPKKSGQVEPGSCRGSK